LISGNASITSVVSAGEVLSTLAAGPKQQGNPYGNRSCSVHSPFDLSRHETAWQHTKALKKPHHAYHSCQYPDNLQRDSHGLEGSRSRSDLQSLRSREAPPCRANTSGLSTGNPDHQRLDRLIPWNLVNNLVTRTNETCHSLRQHMTCAIDDVF
jgi:hypothetical protein